MVVALVRGLLGAGVSPADMGVVTPYLAQVDATAAEAAWRRTRKAAFFPDLHSGVFRPPGHLVVWPRRSSC